MMTREGTREITPRGGTREIAPGKERERLLRGEGWAASALASSNRQFVRKRTKDNFLDAVKIRQPRPHSPKPGRIFGHCSKFLAVGPTNEFL